MKVSSVSSFTERKKADLLVVPFWRTSTTPKLATPVGPDKKTYSFLLATGDFCGKEGQLLFHYTQGEKEPRVALLGLGEFSRANEETMRRAFSAITRLCHRKRLMHVNVCVPEKPSLWEGVVEGLLLPNYHPPSQKSTLSEETAPALIKHLSFVGTDRSQLEKAKRLLQVNESVCFARDLVNGCADFVTPQYLASVAKDLGKQFSTIQSTVWGKKQIEKAKMGLLLAVSQGSACDPAFIALNYTGAPKAKERTVIVGKGVTYDTGGLNLKRSMKTMKQDMAGAAAALGTLSAIAKLKLSINVTVLVPTTENAMGPKSYKPGDIYCGYNGTSVEIDNTDAEGRLILADALAYAVDKCSPTRIIDLATLTGAVIVSLGSEASGLACNDTQLTAQLQQASEETFERTHPLPLYPEYLDLLRSDSADLKNGGEGGAKSSVAAIFLQQFVGSVPWAHFDIAGTAYLAKEKRYQPKSATGVGVRLLVRFLENIQ